MNSEVDDGEMLVVILGAASGAGRMVRHRRHQ